MLNQFQHNEEIILNLVMTFLSGGHSNSVFVLSKLWQVSESSVISGLQRMYIADPTTLSRILDVAQDMKVCSVGYDLYWYQQ